MPTYDYQCQECGKSASVYQTIGEYSRAPVRPKCDHHGEMRRRLSVVPAMSGLANALAGDRHYDGMRAPDGTDISTRTKHREYMKSRGLTTADDFKETWKKAADEREKLRSGTFQDPELKRAVAEAFYTQQN